MTERLSNLELDVVRTIELLRVPCTEFLILDAGPYYVQLIFNRHDIYGEAVSNHYLGGHDQLTPDQEFRLLDLGWWPPNTPCHPWCEQPHPNFNRIWAAATPSPDIARDLLRTLVAVYLRGEGQRIDLRRGRRVTEPSSSPPPRH